MLRKKLNELQKDNSTIINRDLTNINKLQAIKNISTNIINRHYRFYAILRNLKNHKDFPSPERISK